MAPQTGISASSSASAPTSDNISTGQNANMTTKGRKRKSTEIELSERHQRDKQAKNSDASNESEIICIDDDDDDDDDKEEESKPRLTTPDLEFDYDRSQLRDPRPTPGRVKRPRREKPELTVEFKKRFYIPEPAKPKSRLNSTQGEKLFKQKALLDPSEMFHDLYTCHRKGRTGSPTYDQAGFQLDWKKVDDWMKPRAYNKSSAVKGMSKALERHARERREMYEIFFVDGKGPECEPTYVMDYLRDHVSKDLGIPWHQIGPKQLVEWEKRGFPKQKAEEWWREPNEEWWREPNEEERTRIVKMMEGASLRKDL
ncbi:hypothetical protein F4820DRAFT_109162 [Hypoxylon rubiginosum]|uniref:Uncharacterized protein n=1 Tax=Hypoxylon rubiginosum TaxID=110542 RepID=A0ACB9YMJ5_9PEZI|nr:hypothetical protein F4820DRAFT_109162 [Hypoxylon rubiginosum]